MKPKTIKTNERIFEVSNKQGEIYLCNLRHFNLIGGILFGAQKEKTVRIRHYWNNSLKKISKAEVKEMLLNN